MDFENETYTSPDGEFVVNLPGLVHVNARDSQFPGQLFVDFFTGSGYWELQGLYTIEWLKLSEEITSEKYKELLPSIMSHHAEKRFASSGNFQIVEQQSFSDDDSHVFLAQGVLQGVPSTWICTIKLYKNRIAFISKVLPLEGVSPITKLGQNTEYYNEWVRSFTIL
jgi:hypothetical protein